MNTAVERCVLCGGVLGSFRVLVGGEPFHPRCCSHDGRDHRIEELETAIAAALLHADKNGMGDWPVFVKMRKVLKR